MSDSINISQIISGKQFPAIKQIRLYSSDDWEEFIEEWLTTKENDYIEIENLGGAGDQGRDVIGIVKKDEKSYVWDNYQCKHYDHALAPGDIWLELGKLCFYTFNEEFPIPRKYYFVAPFGIGTSLSNFIRNPQQINNLLIEKWEKKCLKHITSKHDVVLEKELLDFVKNFDFSILNKISPLTLITDHLNGDGTSHARRFGGGIPTRPKPLSVPKKIETYELTYIDKLLKAYESDGSCDFVSVNSLPQGSNYKKHLNRSRENFHQAEQLKNFSRDKIDADVFESFKDEVLSGVIDITEEEHESGFKCVKEVEKEARHLSILSNPLSICSDSKDRVGVCHHLANENELNWLEYEK